MAKRFARSALYMGDRESQNEEIAKVTPSSLLRGETPRLTDEWQIAPVLWDVVRNEVDRRSDVGQFILTGSVDADFSQVHHSGVGRISRLRLRTMTLLEMGDSTGEVGLGSLFRGEDAEGFSEHTAESMARILVMGGWPQSVGRSETVRVDAVEGYCEAIVETEVSMADGVRRDSEKVRAIMRSLSRMESSSASNAAVYRDVRNGTDMHMNTFNSYLDAIRRIHVTEDLHAWSPSLRSKTAIRTTPVRHMSDPAIAAYFLGSSADDLIMDIRTYGLLFESLVVRDLRVYAESIGGRAYHYRDKDGLEADLVIHLRNGRWGAVEVKLGGQDNIEAGAKSLRALSMKVDDEYRSKLSFLAVVTAGGYAYRREDGVYVVPIGCLAPRPSPSGQAHPAQDLPFRL